VIRNPQQTSFVILVFCVISTEVPRPEVLFQDLRRNEIRGWWWWWWWWPAFLDQSIEYPD